MAQTARTLVTVLTFFGVLAYCIKGQSNSLIVLNPSEQYQRISGWEATAQAGQDEPGFSKIQDQLFQRSANELGINRLRLEIHSGAENTHDYFSDFRAGTLGESEYVRCYAYTTVNDDNDPFSIRLAGFIFSGLDNQVESVVLPLKKSLEARGETLFLNVTYVAFSAGKIDPGCPAGLQYHHSSPEEYAEFVLATHIHLRDKYALIPDSWEAILEPDNTGFWRGPQIGAAIAAAARRLVANGFVPRFTAPSTLSAANAVPYLTDILAVPGTTPYLKELSYHRYGGGTIPVVRGIALAARQAGLDTAMLEHIGSGSDDLYVDLTEGGNTAWQQFALAFQEGDDGSKYYVIDNTNPAAPVLRLAEAGKRLAQYFRYIRAGAVRIGAATSDSNLRPVAFINPGGRHVVVVQATGSATFGIQGLPAGRYGVSYTTASVYNVSQSDTVISPGQTLLASIPAAGVITIYGRPGLSEVPSISAVVNAATGLVGNLSPGEIVSIYGTGLGGPVGINLQLSGGSFVSTALAGTRILINGVPSPVLYASANQVNIVVPYEVQPGTAANIVAQSGGVSSSVFQTGVGETSPGLFTLNSSGTGAVAALNLDGSVNTSSNPAARGS